MTEPWLSAQEIAAHVGLARESVHVEISDKAMPARRVGRFWKFRTSEVDEWVRRGRAAQVVGSESPKPGEL